MQFLISCMKLSANNHVVLMLNDHFFCFKTFIILLVCYYHCIEKFCGVS